MSPLGWCVQCEVMGACPEWALNISMKRKPLTDHTIRTIKMEYILIFYRNSLKQKFVRLCNRVNDLRILIASKAQKIYKIISLQDLSGVFIKSLQLFEMHYSQCILHGGLIVTKLPLAQNKGFDYVSPVCWGEIEKKSWCFFRYWLDAEANNDPVHRRKGASLGGNELTHPPPEKCPPFRRVLYSD